MGSADHCEVYCAVRTHKRGILTKNQRVRKAGSKNYELLYFYPGKSANKHGRTIPGIENSSHRHTGGSTAMRQGQQKLRRQCRTEA